ncbi:MAG: hypothetical protein ACI85I_001915 [Arenicella sp.]|jgi:hypothetical protein
MQNFDSLHFLLADELFITDRVAVEGGDEKELQEVENAKPPFEFFGENKSQTLILVNEPLEDLLKSREYDFLLKIMAAVRHTPNEFALVNLHNQNEASWENLVEILNPKQVITFEVDMKTIGLELELAEYEIKLHESIKFLYSHRLRVLLGDTTRHKKGRLWKALKMIFTND